MESKKLKRLSELSAIARTRELTEEEQTERTALRNEYRRAVTGSLRTHLDSLTIVSDDGSIIRRAKNSFDAGEENSSGDDERPGSNRMGGEG